MSVVFALACSAAWGFSDFIGGVMSRRISLLRVLLYAQATGLVLAAVTSSFLGGPLPTPGQAASAVAAGTVNLIGLAGLYQALALGTMSVVAPIAATSAAVPVVVGLVAYGEGPAELQGIGMAAAAVGVVMAVRSPGPGFRSATSPASLALAAVAMLGFGAGQVALASAAQTEIWWTVLIAKSTALTWLVATALLVGWRVREQASAAKPLAATRPNEASGTSTVQPQHHTDGAPANWADRRILIGNGFLEVAGTGFYAAATLHGLLSVVAILGSLYPLVTVLMARACLHERLATAQTVGVFLALAGVAAIATA